MESRYSFRVELPFHGKKVPSLNEAIATRSVPSRISGSEGPQAARPVSSNAQIATRCKGARVPNRRASVSARADSSLYPPGGRVSSMAGIPSLIDNSAPAGERCPRRCSHPG